MYVCIYIYIHIHIDIKYIMDGRVAFGFLGVASVAFQVTVAEGGCRIQWLLGFQGLGFRV